MSNKNDPKDKIGTKTELRAFVEWWLASRARRRRDRDAARAKRRTRKAGK